MPRLSPAEWERRKKLVEPLLLKSWTEHDIAREIKLTIKQVKNVIKGIISDWYDEIPCPVIATTRALPRWDFFDRKQFGPLYIHRHVDRSSHVGEITENDIRCPRCDDVTTVFAFTADSNQKLMIS